MDAELMKAVKAVIEGDPSQYPAMSRIDNLRTILSAYVAEIRKRRAESPWKGPFTVHEGPMYVSVLNQESGLCVIAYVPIEIANIHAAALNAYYGYTADGQDMLEGMGI